MDAFVGRSGRCLALACALLSALATAALAGSCSGSKSSQPVSAQSTGDGGGVASSGDITPDAGTPDAGGPDAGSPDGGVQFGGPGPWPVSNQAFGSTQGIRESPVVGMSTDEAQNLWVATNTALYLMRPGDAAFTRYSSADGLHLMDNPDMIHEDSCNSTAIVPGAAVPPGISTIVGGAAGEVFVGYFGTLAKVGDCTDSAVERHSGKLDRVRLQPDGTLEVRRFDLASAGFGLNFWHNRSVLRMVYDHFQHPHTLYVGTDHGVDLILPDQYRPPNPGEWSGFPILEYMGDHLHPSVCIGASGCPLVGEGNQRMGEWRGLATSPTDGDLWVAGRWSAGKIRWDPLGPFHWEHDRSGAQAFSWAFGDPAATNPPVFPVATEGEIVSLTSVAAAPDDTSWWGNKNIFGNPGETDRGVASFTPGKGFTYYDPVADLGMSERAIQDIVALPDGRLVFAGPSTGLVFYDPTTKKHVAMRSGQGIPDDRVMQLELDTMVDPPALHVSTAGGAATIRVFP
jgi:hypothetical protein